MTNEQERMAQLQALEARQRIFDGLVRVLGDLHAFVDVALAGTDLPDTIEALRAAFGLSEVQALAALDMQFRRLSTTGRDRIHSEVNEMRAEHERLARA